MFGVNCELVLSAQLRCVIPKLLQYALWFEIESIVRDPFAACTLTHIEYYVSLRICRLPGVDR